MDNKAIRTEANGWACVFALVLGTALLISGCGGGGGDSNTGRTYNTVGGAVQLNLVNNQGAGLPAGLILSDGNETFTVPAGATSFVFPTGLGTGETYNVSVVNAPAGLSCTVTAPSGAMGKAAVSNVQVYCSDMSFQLGGGVTGMQFGGGVQLAVGNDTIVVSPSTLANAGGANPVSYTTSCVQGSTDSCRMQATWKFPLSLPFGTPYDIQVQGQSLVQCGLGNGAGTVGAANITDVALICTTPQLGILAGGPGFTLGGANSGTGAAAAQFSGASGLAVDTSGNVYVADSRYSRIRKISTLGVVTTLAGPAPNPDGSGITGTSDGTGSAATFNQPEGIALDAQGNLYVADTYNHLIRKITQTSPGVWEVSTLAGQAGSSGQNNGAALSATFNYPRGLTVDASGNVYVAERDNNLIRKISAGVVSTVAGGGTGIATDGQGTAATFDEPYGVTWDSTTGNLYVADRGNSLIRKIDPNGIVSTWAGQVRTFSHVDGQGTAATFNSPDGVATDAHGNIYVADTDNNLIRKITPAGLVSTLVGTGVGGTKNGMGTMATISQPVGPAVDQSGNVYVLDTYGNIRKITSSGFVSTFAGSNVTGSEDGMGTAASFHDPQGLAVDDSNNVYVADSYSNKIRKITPAGVVSTFAGSGDLGGVDGPVSSATFAGPSSIAVYTSPSGVTVYVGAGTSTRKISSGAVTTMAVFGDPLAVDSSGNLYSWDGSNLLIKTTPQGLVTTLASGFASSPAALAVDAAFNVYAVDGGAPNAILKITSAGAKSTLAGSGTPGYSDGTGSAATFGSINAMAVDPTGNVYVADGSNQLIRKVGPAGNVTTLAGTVGYAGSITPSILPGGFQKPWGIALSKPDSATGNFNLYFTTGNAVAVIVNVNAY